jgi:hypothetical protein
VFEFFTKYMSDQLSARPDLAKILIPDFAVGWVEHGGIVQSADIDERNRCRRLTPGNGFLQALQQPNVTLETKPIVRITENAIVTEDGREHEVDVLICATGNVCNTSPKSALRLILMAFQGFDLSFKPRFELRGRNGVDLRRQWDPRPTACEWTWHEKGRYRIHQLMISNVIRQISALSHITFQTTQVS